jgi:adhesin/invasin
MVTQRSAGIALVSLLALPFALISACDKVPLLAPTGSVINLLATTNTVSLNSEITIIATVIENGTAPAGGGPGTGPTTTTTRTGAGTPVQNGTLVSFTTTLGRIEPSEARTHNGQVSVRFITGSASGTATITAFSGGASSQITNLKVGTAAAGRVIVTTTPQALGASGGSVQVTANVTDEGGNPLSGIPVSFATDKGSLSPSLATSDANGNATVTLTTTTGPAVITATAGAQSGKATVTLAGRSLASFTASVGGTTAGTPVTFTVLPAANSNISNVRIDFGDGDGIDLGPISQQSNASHAYSSPGSYTATATATDATGDRQVLSTGLLIGALPVTLAASDPTPTVNTSVTFTASGVTGVQVSRYHWTFDDGTGPFDTSGPSISHTFTTRGAKNVRVDVIGVNGAQLGSASTAVNVE